MESELTQAQKVEAEGHVAPKRGDGITITRGEMLSGVATYSAQDQDDLIWLHGYACEIFGGSRSRLMEALRDSPDWTTLWKVWSGKYEAEITKIMQKVRIFRKRAHASARTRFIRTCVTEKIFQVCDVARDRGVMVYISGPSGRSKTHSLLEWRHQNNHGRALYVYAPSAGGFRAFLEKLAENLNISIKNNNYALMQKIENGIDNRNVLIIDEMMHLYPTGKASSLQSLEFIRELHDRKGCGVVCCATDGLERQMAGGRWAEWFVQFLGRIDLPLRIPKKFGRQELGDILAAYVDVPGRDLIEVARSIANNTNRGCRELFRHLNRAAQVASDTGEPLTGALLNKTRDMAIELLTIDED